MQQIGKGSFTTVYLKSENVVLLKSTDLVKRRMSEGIFPHHRMIPKIHLIEHGKQFSYYEMKRYEKVKKIKDCLTPRQYRLYKALKNVEQSLLPGATGEMKWVRAFEELMPAEFKKEKEVIIKIIKILSLDRNDMAFEISRRNIAIHGKKLILLDCFYYRYELPWLKC